MKKIILFLFGLIFNVYFTQSTNKFHPFFDNLNQFFYKKIDSIQKYSNFEAHVYLKDITKKFSAISNNKVTLSSFPKVAPSFVLGSDSSGWSYLNTFAEITIDENQNIILIDIDGTTQIDNLTKNSPYQFAIGIFIDDELKLMKNFHVATSEMSCDFKKFNIAGVFENISLGNHVVKVYAYNLPKLSNNYSKITYGGASTSCGNLNKEMARIVLTAQVAE